LRNQNSLGKIEKLTNENKLGRIEKLRIQNRIGKIEKLGSLSLVAALPIDGKIAYSVYLVYSA